MQISIKNEYIMEPFIFSNNCLILRSINIDYSYCKELLHLVFWKMYVLLKKKILSFRKENKKIIPLLITLRYYLCANNRFKG